MMDAAEDWLCAYDLCQKPKLTQIFRGELYCSEICRKALVGEITRAEWLKVQAASEANK